MRAGFAFKWPDEHLLPGFKETASRYVQQVQSLSDEFIELFTEAFELAPDALADYVPTDGSVQHRVKIAKYPAMKEGESDQGLGPHSDGGLFTFVSVAAVFVLRSGNADGFDELE